MKIFQSKVLMNETDWDNTANMHESEEIGDCHDFFSVSGFHEPCILCTSNTMTITNQDVCAPFFQRYFYHFVFQASSAKKTLTSVHQDHASTVECAQTWSTALYAGARLGTMTPSASLTRMSVPPTHASMVEHVGTGLIGMWTSVRIRTRTVYLKLLLRLVLLLSALVYKDLNYVQVILTEQCGMLQNTCNIVDVCLQ